MAPSKILGLGTAVLCLALAPDAGAAPRRARKAAPAKPRPAPSLLVAPDASPRDLEVAEACRAALDRASGSVIAMDPRNGRVIAVVNPQHGLERAYQWDPLESTCRHASLSIL